jgi:hypothetical protein
MRLLSPIMRGIASHFAPDWKYAERHDKIIKKAKQVKT